MKADHKLKYFETHVHYTSDQFADDQHEAIMALPDHGVTYAVNIGSSMSDSLGGVELADKYPHMYATVGFHPHYTNSMKDYHLEELEELSAHKKVVGIGEIGLDFHYDHSPRDVQAHWFWQQLLLTKRLDMPVVIHCREAHGETFDTLRNIGLTRRSGAGVIHCYSGSVEMAKQYVKMGYYIGIGGVVTYKNAQNLPEVVAEIPLERLLIETDAPYLSPVPNRGKRNDSTNLKYIVEAIAKIKDTTPKKVAAVTMDNAKSFYGVK